MALDLFKLSGSVEISTGKAEASLKRVESSARQTQQNLDKTGNAGRKAGDGISSGFDRATSGAHKLHSALGSVSSGLGKISSMGSGLSSMLNVAGGNLISGAVSSALSAVTGALKEGWQSGIAYNKMLEKASVSFETLLGSADAAKQHISALTKFGLETPFELGNLIKASQRMQAMGFAAKDVIPSLKAIGNAVSAAGGGKEELDGITLALGQMNAKGHVSAQEMNQLAERGIPAWDLLAQKVGMTKGQLMKLGEQGKLSGSVAVKMLTSAMGEKYGGQMDKAMKTLEGQESNFQDILNQRLGEATTGNFEQLKAGYEKATQGLATSGAKTFGVEINRLLTDTGKLIEPALQGLATGEYFKQGATAISKGYEASDEFKKGNYGNAASAANEATKAATGQPLYDWKSIGTTGGGALGVLTGGKAVTLGGLAEKFGLLGTQAADSFSKGVASGAPAASAAGVLVGAGAEGGVKDKLQQHSPSKVMIDLGATAAQSFVDAFSGTMEAGKGKISKSPVDVAKMQAAIIADLEKLLADPKIKAMLDTLKKAEGAGYNTLFGGGTFKGNDAFPDWAGKRFNYKGKDGKTHTDISRAAGAYQYIPKTWNSVQGKLGLPDFSPHSQDLGAVSLMKQRGMIDPIMKGDVAGALTKGNEEWASLPGSPYGQPTRKASELITFYNAALEKHNGVAASASTATSTLSNALAGMRDTITSAAAPVMSLFGYGSAAKIAPPSLPKAAAPPIPSRPGDGASARPFTAAAAILPNVPAVTAKLTPLTAGVDKLAPPIVAATKAATALPAPVAASASAMNGAAAAAGVVTKASQEEIAALLSVGDATAKAIDHLSHFKDALANGFDDVFDSILNGQKVSGKDIAKGLFKGVMGSIISGATGGKASTPGQFLSGMLTGGFKGGSGGAGAPGGGSGIGDFLTGGFAGGKSPAAGMGGGGGNPISGALDMAKNVGGMFKQGGMLSKLPGIGKLGGFLGKLPGLGKLGGLLGMGGGGAAGGAAGATGMAAMFSNPVTGAIAAGLIAAPFIAKWLGKDPLSDYKKHVKSEYGVSASKQILSKIMQIGQSKFGTEWEKRKIETVRLPEVRDMLSEYSGAFSKGGNNKLFDSRLISDQFNSANRFKVPMMAAGGYLNAGQAAIVGERRAELFIPQTSGRIVPNTDGMRGGQGSEIHAGMFTELLESVRQMAEAANRLNSMPPDHVVMTGLNRNPDLAAAAVEKSFSRRSESSRAIRDHVATR